MPERPKQRLAGKRCIITGGSRGLGRALCQRFAAEGAKVAFTWSRDDEDAEETRASIRDLRGSGDGTVLSFKGSVDDSSHAKAVVKAVVAEWGGVDVLVNNAAVTQVLPIALLEEADWDRVMSVNVKGPYLFSRAVLKPMIRARGGHILSIGNFASERLIEAPVHYAASKSALRGFTEALAREVGRYGIGVNLLSPGLMDCGLSQMLPQHRIDEYLDQCAMGRLAQPEEIADLAVFLVSSDNTFMTGAKVVADGGL